MIKEKNNMSAEIGQLQSINVKDFRVIVIDNDTYLSLIPDDSTISPSGAAIMHDKKISFNTWLKKWNVDELIEIESNGLQYLSRKLTQQEKESFEYYRQKMLRCKRYGLNYYENEVFEKL
jgi:hypothetical protein